MSKITVNIISYDFDSDTLIVTFTDGKYTAGPLAYQPYNFNTLDIEEIKKIIAYGGKETLEYMKRVEEYKKSNSLRRQFGELANTSYSYALSELSENDTVSDNGLEVTL